MMARYKRRVVLSTRIRAEDREKLRHLSKEWDTSLSDTVARIVEKALQGEAAEREPVRATESVGEPGLGESASEKLDRVLCELAALRADRKEDST